MNLFGLGERVFSEQAWYKKIDGFNFDSMVSSTNRFFNPDNFNTPLPEDRKVEYSNWAKTNVLDSGQDYDYVGAFLAGYGRDKAGNGHLPDTFKKPNHPTFSVESQYATGVYRKYAGKWNQNKAGEFTFSPARTTLKAVNSYTKIK